jgi:hypothetical protein
MDIQFSQHHLLKKLFFSPKYVLALLSTFSWLNRVLATLAHNPT